MKQAKSKAVEGGSRCVHCTALEGKGGVALTSVRTCSYVQPFHCSRMRTSPALPACASWVAPSPGMGRNPQDAVLYERL